MSTKTTTSEAGVAVAGAKRSATATVVEQRREPSFPVSPIRRTEDDRIRSEAEQAAADIAAGR